MKLTKTRQLYTRRLCASETIGRRFQAMFPNRIMDWFTRSLNIHRCVGAHYKWAGLSLCAFVCLLVFVCNIGEYAVNSRNIIAYTDKIWMAVIHHTVTLYCCVYTRHRVKRTSTCEHLFVARATFSFSFALSLLLTLLKSMTKCTTAITRAHEIDIQT